MIGPHDISSNTHSEDSDMSSLLASVPKAVREPVGNCAAFIQRNYGRAQAAYGRLEDSVVAYSAERLPESMTPVAEKVIRAVPETLYCASMFTGVGRLVAIGIFATKTIQILSPLVAAAVQKGIDKETMSDALEETKGRFDNTLANLAPAMLTTGACGAATAAIFGVFRCNVTLVMQSVLFGALSYHGYQAMHIPAAASEPVVATS